MKSLKGKAMIKYRFNKSTKATADPAQVQRLTADALTVGETTLSNLRELQNQATSWLQAAARDSLDQNSQEVAQAKKVMRDILGALNEAYDKLTSGDVIGALLGAAANAEELTTSAKRRSAETARKADGPNTVPIQAKIRIDCLAAADEAGNAARVKEVAELLNKTQNTRGWIFHTMDVTPESWKQDPPGRLTSKFNVTYVITIGKDEAQPEGEAGFALIESNLGDVLDLALYLAWITEYEIEVVRNLKVH